MAPSAQFELAQPPSDAVSSIAFAPSSSSRIIASSWDRNVYLYSIDGSGERSEDGVQGSLIRTYEHRAPVMGVCFGASDDEAFSAGMDWQVSRIDLESGEITALSKHAAPVRQVVYSREHSLLISASWDSTLHIHKMSDPSSTPLVIPLPAKPHALAASPSKVVVAMTARLVHIYDLATLSAAASVPSGQQPPPQPWQTRESSLKFLTRAVAAMPSDAGYATSSIEGRVSVEWFDDSAESQARKYAFKCHRQTSPEGTDVVYPVNALAFHPTFGTFASGGGDTTVALWDAEAKRRMKIYPKFPESVAALGFSDDGRYLAIATGPGFETGMEDYSGEGRTKILVRELSETEARPKGAK